MNPIPVNRPRRGRRNRQARGGDSSMSMLTGGTRDVKPQLLSFSAVQSGNDTTTTTAQQLPVLRNFSGQNGSRAQLIEVLKVYFRTSAPTEADSSTFCFLGTKNFAATAVTFAEPSVFAACGDSFVITTSGAVDKDLFKVVDLTDGDGNGLLIGTDSIFAQVQSTSTGAATRCDIKLLYRICGAPLQEWVGIVQSQQ